MQVIIVSVLSVIRDGTIMFRMTAFETVAIMKERTPKDAHTKVCHGSVTTKRALVCMEHTTLEGDARQILDPSKNSSGK